MASIERRKDGYSVRWRDSKGRSKRRQVPDLTTARRVVTEIARARAEGRDWTPEAARECPGLVEIVDAWLAEQARYRTRGTVAAYTSTLTSLLTWLDRQHQGATLYPDDLSRSVLGEWYDSLDVATVTANGYLSRVMVCWEWAYDHEDYGRWVPRPRRPPVRPHIPEVTRAPTWADCDGVIQWLGERVDRGQAIERSWRAVVIQRYTGLRCGQACRLRWSDLDLREGLLYLRGELGKTRAEQRGRVVPLSQHLVDELAGWPRGDLVVQADATADPLTATSGTAERMRAAWRACEIPEALWRHRTTHSLRKAFRTGLRRLGADLDAVDYLVGHSTGIRGVYTDPLALPLRETVDLVPAIGESRVVRIRHSG